MQAMEESEDDSSSVKEDDTDDEDLDPTPEGMASVISKEMYNLSIEEREKVYSDLHGVSDEIDETPEFINESLARLEVELKCLPQKDAYNLANVSSPEYVENREFRLKFLRADNFDPKLAANRMARHFEYKQALFGKHKLTKDIIQDDLDAGALECLYCGFQQMVTEKDRAGRTIGIWFPFFKPKQDHSTMVCLR